MAPLDGATLEHCVRLLAQQIELHTDDLNRLNVYPVPDADTGDNLAAMMRAVLDRFDGSADIVEAVSGGVLHGGRGSSGVIVGQALRAFATAADGSVADALAAAAVAAREVLADPVEGTVLTVAAEAARAAERADAAGGSTADVVAAAASEGRKALARTPDQLPALARAGVVDAGGYGYVLFLDALAEAVTGTPGPAEPVTPARQVAGPGTGGRYEVTCLLAAGGDGAATLRRQWLTLGDTVAVAGTDHTWRCHVHTDDVDAALAAARRVGEISDVTITELP